jgi:hypothetical protein
MLNIKCRTDFDRSVCQPGYGGSHKFSFRSPLAYDFALLLFWPRHGRCEEARAKAAADMHHVGHSTIEIETAEDRCNENSKVVGHETGAS